jgi:hypothetical protein
LFLLREFLTFEGGREVEEVGVLFDVFVVSLLGVFNLLDDLLEDVLGPRERDLGVETWVLVFVFGGMFYLSVKLANLNVQLGVVGLILA